MLMDPTPRRRSIGGNKPLTVDSDLTPKRHKQRDLAAFEEMTKRRPLTPPNGKRRTW